MAENVHKSLSPTCLRVHDRVTGVTLLQASELDPESKEDMALLWAVWYCLDLFPEQAKRLSGFLKRLLKGESGDR